MTYEEYKKLREMDYFHLRQELINLVMSNDFGRGKSEREDMLYFDEILHHIRESGSTTIILKERTRQEVERDLLAFGKWMQKKRELKIIVSEPKWEKGAFSKITGTEE